MSKIFAGTAVPRILKFGTNVGYDLYCVKENQHVAAYHSLYLSISFIFLLSLQLAKSKNLRLQNCFNIPLMAMAGGM